MRRVEHDLVRDRSVQHQSLDLTERLRTELAGAGVEPSPLAGDTDHILHVTFYNSESVNQAPD